MFKTLKQYYTNRNLKIIRTFNKLRENGFIIKDAQIKTAKMLSTDGDTLSAATVRSVMYDPKYSNTKEAHDLYNQEQKALQNVNTENGNVNKTVKIAVA